MGKIRLGEIICKRKIVPSTLLYNRLRSIHKQSLLFASLSIDPSSDESFSHDSGHSSTYSGIIASKDNEKLRR